MKKRILSFKEPIEWEALKDVKLPKIIAISYGGSNKIHAIRCEEDDFEKIATSLKKRKIAFISKAA